MAIKSGKVSVPKSSPGVVPSVEVAIMGMTTAGAVIISLAERDSKTDIRGQMEFYAVCATDKIIIYGEEKELYNNTDLFWLVDTDGTGADVVGLLDLKGDLDASTNPDYPTAVVGDSYIITVDGKVGGASGKDVLIGDFLVCKTDNAGGDEAAVGTSWFVVEKNITDTGDVPEGSNLYYTEGRVSANTDVAANTVHKTSDGKDHFDVLTNNNHRIGDGTDHSDVPLNNTHRSSDGSDHSNVVNNSIHATGSGGDHSDVNDNSMHVNSDGSSHSIVGTNQTHATGDGSDHVDVDANNEHRANVLNAHMDETPEELTGGGPILTDKSTTHLISTGINALSLGDGHEEGQHKYIVMKTFSDVGTLTPDNLANGTTITFSAVGDCAFLIFTNNAWHFMGGTAVLA